MNQESLEEIKAKLAAEVDVVPWSALFRHYAFGRVYQVRSPWTLLDAALAIHQDASEIVKSALAEGRLQKPTDADVKGWVGSDPQFAVLIISPFVLIQEAGSEPAPRP